MTSPRPPASDLLSALHEAFSRDGVMLPAAVAESARLAGIPVARAWEVAASCPDFQFNPIPPGDRHCAGLSCVLAGAATGPSPGATGCQARCYDAPVAGHDGPFHEFAIREAGPVLAPDVFDWQGLDHARAMEHRAALALIERAGLRGRGGAYFPVARKWASALAQGRPVALVVNAEEGEPGVFKDRGILGRRVRRFVEGLAIAMHVIAPAATIVFINGTAGLARTELEAALDAFADALPGRPSILAGGGGYVLGEETTLLNAIEGRRPAPRIRPPYPVEAGLWGMPTVVNNVETIANLSVIFRDGADAFRARGTPEAPGSKLLSVSGRVQRPGLYEVDMGATIDHVLELARGPASSDVTAVLAGGPSGGFLPPSEFGVPLLPGSLHATGAVTGSGGLVFLDSPSSIRQAALAMAAYNAAESCGKCTPCREGLPRALEMLASRQLEGLDELLEVIGTASLCGLGQMAPGPIRSALHFWPELFQ